MSEHSSKDRQSGRFKIIPDTESLVEVQLCDRMGLLVLKPRPREGLSFAVFTGCRTSRAYGLPAGGLCIVDLDDPKSLVAIPLGDHRDHTSDDHTAVVPIRAIVASGVAL